MTTLPVEVDEATADALRRAPPETRERIAQSVADHLRHQVQDWVERERRLESFRQVADEAGRQAKANGRTDELNEALLRGDLDDE